MVAFGSLPPHCIRAARLAAARLACPALRRADCGAWPRVRRERDRLYERAEKVGALLSHLGEQLKEAIADVNDSTCEGLVGFGGWLGRGAVGWRTAKACAHSNRFICFFVAAPRVGALSLPFREFAAASLGDTAAPLGKAVRILNNQLQALAQADARIEELSQRVADLHPN